MRKLGGSVDVEPPVPTSSGRRLPGSVPTEVITAAVRWYLRYRLSYRDVEELLAERGVQAAWSAIPAVARRRSAGGPTLAAGATSVAIHPDWRVP